MSECFDELFAAATPGSSASTRTAPSSVIASVLAHSPPESEYYPETVVEVSEQDLRYPTRLLDQ